MKKILFIQITSEINNILTQLKKISISGYPKIIKVKIEINKEISSYECDSEKTTYENIIKSIKEGLRNLRKFQIEAYEKFPLIRFIYGNQFNLIKRMDNDKIKPLLMYITRNKMLNQIKDFKFSSDENNIESIIESCREYLDETLKKNKLNLDIIYKDSLIFEEFKSKY